MERMERMDSLPQMDSLPRLNAGSLGRMRSGKMNESMRGAVLALDSPGNTTRVSHPTTGDHSAAQAVTALTGPFKLRGELMHSFISYRVATEGEASNASNFSGLLAEKIRALSTDSTHGLQIPRHGWGIWPKAARKPVPFRKEEAKVFLDRECLLDGQSWLAGFVQGSNPNSATSTPNPEPNQTLQSAPCFIRPNRCILHPEP
jgi:hypothetical protein